MEFRIEHQEPFLPAGRNPMEEYLSLMGGLMGHDDTWFVLFEHHRNNEWFILIHRPSGIRVKISVPEELTRALKAQRVWERDNPEKAKEARRATPGAFLKSLAEAREIAEGLRRHAIHKEQEDDQGVSPAESQRRAEKRCEDAEDSVPKDDDGFYAAANDALRKRP